MNRGLRKMCNVVNSYVILLSPKNSGDLRQNHEKYLAEVEELNDIIDTFFDDTLTLFAIWCIASVQVFSQESTNVFLRIKRHFSMMIVNHYLNKYSYEMSVCGILQNNLKAIKQRLIQYDIFS